MKFTERTFLPLMFTAVAILAVFGLWIERQPNAQKPSQNTNQAQEIDTSHWLTYSDKQLGISFKYPANLSIKNERELADIDSGKKYELNIGEDGTNTATIVALSSDFREGVGEGSRWYYSANPIDTSRTTPDTNKEMKSLFFAASEPIKIQIDSVDGFSFFQLMSYGESWYRKVYLIPFKQSGYSNLMIYSNPDLNTRHNNQGAKDWFYGLEKNEQLFSDPIFESLVKTIKVQNT